MGFFNNLFAAKNETDFKELVKQGALIIDVRTAGEYNSGHIPGSVNIELEKVNSSVQSLKKMKKPMIAVCRSGNRSGVAVNILKAAGVEAYNGGAWDDLQKKVA
jgi:phage shock protein E